MTTVENIDPLAIAREIAAMQPTGYRVHLVFQTAKLRDRTELGVAEAKALIVQANDELTGTYYLVTPSNSKIVGPHVGLEAAEAAVTSSNQVIVLVISISDSPHQAATRLIRALPDPRDEDVVDQLLKQIGESSSDMVPILGSRWSRERLIREIRERIAREQ